MGRCDDCMKNPIHPDKKCCFNCARSGANCEVWHNCGEDCPGWDRKVVTNADRIRAMTDEELAKFIPNWSYTDACKCVEKPYVDCNNECEKCVSEWLQQPAEDL